MKYDYLFKFVGLCGVLVFFVVLISIIFSINMSPWFSWTENALSDLGRPEGASTFFNANIALAGLLLCIFSFGLLIVLTEDSVGPTMLGFSSIFLFGVGINPLPSQEHVILSCCFFIAFPLGFLALGYNLFKKEHDFQKKMGKFAIGIAMISFCTPIFLLFLKGIAIPESVVIFPGLFWCFVYGFNLFTEKEYI